MTMQNLDWNNIRSLNNSQKEGFEELVCQLAKNDNIENKKSFVRKGSPDAGVECFWILNDDSEICYQAKFFTSPLTSTQWGEIDESVKTALDKHPNIIKYIISIPQDRADARIIGRKSFLDKWNDSVIKWRKWAIEKEKDVEFVYEGSSELLNKLSKHQNSGKILFWFNKVEFSNEWFKNINEEKIKDLGARYTPEINVDSDIHKIFKPLLFPKKVNRKVFGEYKKLEKIFFEYLKLSKDYKSIYQELKTLLNEFKRNKENLQTQNISDLKEQDILSHAILEKINNLLEQLYHEFVSKDLKINRRNDKNTVALRDKINLTSSYINKFLALLNDPDFRLAKNPFLIIEGEAGIGKSHLIADLVSRKFIEHPTILLLGQQFYSENIWIQINNQLNLNCSKEDFLGALNSKGESINSRVLIFIDAINEGDGKFIWREQLSGFVNTIKKYTNIGLVISIRSTYKNYILTESNLKDFFTHELIGFKNLHKATKTFFKFYQIQELPIPILNPEFNNPLFLKLFCKGLRDNGISTIPDNYDNINHIFNYLFQAVNNSLSFKLGYDAKNFNLVVDSINLLASEMIKDSSYQMTRKKANELLIEKYRGFVPNSGMILSELIRDNILNENIVFDIANNQNKEIIYFSYEKLGDYVIAKNLLKTDSEKIKTLIREDIKNIDSSFELYNILKNSNSININLGIIEALSIILPETYKIDLFQITNDNEFIRQSLLKSLLWRNSSTINDRTLKYINEHIKYDKKVLKDLIEILLQLSVRVNHKLNINFVDSILRNKNIKSIDLNWTIYINHSNIPIILANWILETPSIENSNKETKEILSLTLSWLLTSSNREIRDKSTKALCKVLQKDIEIIIKLINDFKSVDDLYILERLFAVLYAITISINDKSQISKIIGYITDSFLSKIFQKNHILIEDYISGIFEYGFKIGLIEDKEKFILPNRLLDKDLLKYQFDLKKYIKRDGAYECHNILVSYITGEHNFFRKLLGNQDNFKISNVNTLSSKLYNKLSLEKENVSLMERLTYFYKLRLDEEILLSSGINNDKISEVENILIENNNLTEQETKSLFSYIEANSYPIESKSYFDLSFIQYFVAQDIFEEFKWTDEEFKEHDLDKLKSNFYKKNIFNKNESIGEKYMFLSSYKWLSVICHNFLITSKINNIKIFNEYKRYWNFLQRDIDPTTFHLINYEKNDSLFKENHNLQARNFINIDNYEDWISIDSSLITLKNYDESIITNFYNIRSFLVKKDELSLSIRTLKEESFSTAEAIHSKKSVENIYAGEFYWSEGFKNQDICNINRLYKSSTTISYFWSSDTDFSLDADLQIKQPSTILFDLLEINKVENNNYFDKLDNLILTNKTFENGNSFLLLSKKALVEKIYEKGFEFIFVSYNMREIDYEKINEVSKIFLLDDKYGLIEVK